MTSLPRPCACGVSRLTTGGWLLPDRDTCGWEQSRPGYLSGGGGGTTSREDPVNEISQLPQGGAQPPPPLPSARVDLGEGPREGMEG